MEEEIKRKRKQREREQREREGRVCGWMQLASTRTLVRDGEDDSSCIDSQGVA